MKLIFYFLFLDNNKNIYNEIIYNEWINKKFQINLLNNQFILFNHLHTVINQQSYQDILIKLDIFKDFVLLSVFIHIEFYSCLFTLDS